MAIDAKVFKDTWAMLCDRFNREPSQPLALAYYRTLDEQMTTASFRMAAQIIFEEREFFPRPVDFLDAQRTDPSTAALKEWPEVQKYMAGSEYDLSPEALRVVGLMGGRRELGQTRLENMPHVRREFLALYRDTVVAARREHRIALAAAAPKLLP